MITADEYYLQARDAAMDAARRQAGKGGNAVLRTADGTTLRVTWRTPLRICLLMITRYAPGQDRGTAFNFQRSGRVDLGGDRRVPLREAVAAGHDPWASRRELEELTAQIDAAVVVRRTSGFWWRFAVLTAVAAAVAMFARPANLPVLYAGEAAALAVTVAWHVAGSRRRP